MDFHDDITFVVQELEIADHPPRAPPHETSVAPQLPRRTASIDDAGDAHGHEQPLTRQPAGRDIV